MANLTVVIDDDVLKQARIRAVREGTSVSVIVRECLESYASRAEANAAAMRRFLDWADTVDAGSGPGGRTWTRDELYDR